GWLRPGRARLGAPLQLEGSGPGSGRVGVGRFGDRPAAGPAPDQGTDSGRPAFGPAYGGRLVGRPPARPGAGEGRGEGSGGGCHIAVYSLAGAAGVSVRSRTDRADGGRNGRLLAGPVAIAAHADGI